jgi:NCS1 family nucleobase:cation symporter-1
MQPWRLLADPSGYIFAWLVGYSGGLGSIAGVLIADYWLVRNKRLALPDLYRTKGVYTYSAGWNSRAVVATLLGCALAWGGKILAWFGITVTWLLDLYPYAWFVGFAVAAIAYLVLMKAFPPSSAAVFEAKDA